MLQSDAKKAKKGSTKVKEVGKPTIPMTKVPSGTKKSTDKKGK